MLYYIDTEFIERGHEHPIELISLAVVCEDGRWHYRELSDGWDPAHANDWVKENVLPHLGKTTLPVTRAELARELIAIVGGDEQPEFWGYYCDYDWVVFCQLFGSMVDLPERFPMFCRDVKQLAETVAVKDLSKRVPHPGPEHNALADARHIRAMHVWLLNRDLDEES